MRQDTDVFERWGQALAGGFQVVPNELFRLQRMLGLSSHQVVILLNLSMHWWKKKNLPFVGPNIIAKRMGVSRRTVERQLKELCDKGLVQRKPLRESIRANTGYRIGYDLAGLVARLEMMSPDEPKSIKLAERINGLRAERAAAALEDMTRQEASSSSELRG